MLAYDKITRFCQINTILMPKLRIIGIRKNVLKLKSLENDAIVA